jgi:hypothetical protein
MSKISKTETDRVLADLVELKGGVELLTQEGHVHAEMLAQVIILLTPPERAPGPSLHELIVALISRMDRQSVMLKEVIESLSDLRRNLATEVARLLREGLPGDVETARRASGGNGLGPNGANGHGEGHSA